MKEIKYIILCLVINYGSGSGSDFLTSYGSGSTSQKVTVPMVPVPVLVPQHWLSVFLISLIICDFCKQLTDEENTSIKEKLGT